MVISLLISVVDNDISVRESLPELLRLLGYATQVFASAEEFLASAWLSQTQCLIVDIALPGRSGPELQLELMRLGQKIPIIFVTALEDETVRQRLVSHGAVECLFKPFTEAALLAALDTALPVE